MLIKVRWEERPEVKANPKLIEDFVRSYDDHNLSLKLIQVNFGMSSSEVVHAVAKRLGCVSRPINQIKVHPAKGVSVHALDDEIAQTRMHLVALEQKKIDLEMRVERQGSYIRVLGLDCDILVSAVLWTRWLKAGGPAKVRHLITEAEWNG